MPCKSCQEKQRTKLPVPAEMTKVTGVTNMTYDFANDSDFLLVQYIYPHSAAVITSNDPDFYEKYGMRNYGRQAKGFRFYMLKSDYEANQLYQDRLAVIETEPEVVEEPVAQVEEKPVETPEEKVEENTEEEKPKKRRTSKKKEEETSEDKPEESDE